MDPMVQYILLGDDISSGVLACISLGIDRKASQENITPAARWISKGGVVNANASPHQVLPQSLVPAAQMLATSP